MNVIKKLPIPAAGLILALLSLGNLVQDINSYLRYIFAGIGVFFIILMILKVLLYPQDIRKDFKNPVIASSSGTFSMSLMLLSTYIIEFIPNIAYAIWIIGICLHILLIIYFAYHFIVRNFDITTAYPSYWIVFVGITMGAITAPAYGIKEIGFIFFIIGFIAMIVTLPLIVYRYIRYPSIPDMNKPLICIFTALMSILIVGYINSAASLSSEFLTVIYSISIIIYIFALYKFIDYRNLEFYPSFAAFTFPFVISALATKGILKTYNTNAFLSPVLAVETLIALAIVIYILIRYVKFLKK